MWLVIILRGRCTDRQTVLPYQLSYAVLVYIVQQKLDTVLLTVHSNDGSCLTGQRNHHLICQVQKIF